MFANLLENQSIFCNAILDLSQLIYDFYHKSPTTLGSTLSTYFTIHLKGHIKDTNLAHTVSPLRWFAPLKVVLLLGMSH